MSKGWLVSNFKKIEEYWKSISSATQASLASFLPRQYFLTEIAKIIAAYAEECFIIVVPLEETWNPRTSWYVCFTLEWSRTYNRCAISKYDWYELDTHKHVIITNPIQNIERLIDLTAQGLDRVGTPYFNADNHYHELIDMIYAIPLSTPTKCQKRLFDKPIFAKIHSVAPKECHSIRDLCEFFGARVDSTESRTSFRFPHAHAVQIRYFEDEDGKVVVIAILQRHCHEYASTYVVPEDFEFGLDSDEITVIQQQLSCNRQTAASALRRHDRNIVDAILCLTP